jgi:hypothetical protein
MVEQSQIGIVFSRLKGKSLWESLDSVKVEKLGVGQWAWTATNPGEGIGKRNVCTDLKYFWRKAVIDTSFGIYFRIWLLFSEYSFAVFEFLY